VRILVVAATDAEIAPFAAGLELQTSNRFRLKGYTRSGHDVDILTTGVGMVATAAWCSRMLAEWRYDFALNLGLCGSFDRALPPGTVVHVISDRVSELGAEDGDAFLTMEALALLRDNDLPFTGDRPMNTRPPRNEVLRLLPEVDAITVNTVHGADQSIADVVARFKPQVESMEGAAFMYTCLIHDVPYAQVRAVSNIIERRNRASWRIEEAVRMLGSVSLAIVDNA
jgi:futalosine hydrolase